MNGIQIDSRGVSNALAFVLIFGIAVGSVFVVFSSGITTLDDLREAERANNAERAMFIIHQNVENIHNDGVAGRDTEVQLTESQLMLQEGSQFEVWEGTDPDYDDEDREDFIFSRRSFVLDYSVTDDRSTVYEFGALIRETPAGPVMVQDPPFSMVERGDTDRLLVTPVELQGGGNVAGGKQLVVFRGGGSGLETVEDEKDITIRMETNPDRTDAWVSYYEDELEAENVEVTGEDEKTVEATFEDVEIVIRTQSVVVDFES